MENAKKLIKVLFLYIIPLVGITHLTGIAKDKYSTIIILFAIYGLKKIYDYTKDFKLDKRKMIVISILSFILSFFIVAGNLIDQNFYNYSYLLNDDLLKLGVGLYSCFVLVFAVIKAIYYKLDNLNKIEQKYNPKYKYIFFIFMIICWLPYLINFYPALMSPDSLNQYGQAINAVALSNHHPIAHTMLIKVFIFIGNIFNNHNLGLCFYSLFQMIVLSGVFSYILDYIYKKRGNLYLVGFFLLMYAFVPVFGFYVVTIWKDVLFGAFGALLTIQLYKLLNEDKYTTLDKILLFVSVLLSSLLRTNALYAVLVLSIIATIALKKTRKLVVFNVLVPTVLAFIIVGPVYNSFGISKTEFTENIGIFIRQVYGTIYDKGNVDDESREFLSKLVNEEEALKAYTPFDDHIKMADSYSNEFLEENKGEFIKTYLRLGLHNKVEYINLYLKSTYGVWYPEAQGYIVHLWPIKENEYGVYSYENFDKLKATTYEAEWYNKPVVKYFMSEALYIWVMLICLAYVIIKKNYKNIIIILFPLLVWLTIMAATPLSYQPRYMFVMHCSIPMIVLCGVESFNKEEKKATKKTKKAK